jgi:hypothetical protein
MVQCRVAAGSICPLHASDLRGRRVGVLCRRRVSGQSREAYVPSPPPIPRLGAARAARCWLPKALCQGVRRRAPAWRGGSGELGGASAARVGARDRATGCLPRAASFTRDGEGTATSLPLGASAGAHSPRKPHPTVAASAKGFRTAPTRCQGSQPPAGCTVALAAGPLSRSQVVTGTAHTPRAQSGRGVAGDAVTAVDSAQRRASAAQAEPY